MSEYAVPVEEAMSRLVVVEDYDPGDGPQPCVHTFRGSVIPIGAHWSVAAAREAMERFGVEEAGEQASGMGHPLVVIDDHGPVFFEARPPGEKEKS